MKYYNYHFMYGYEYPQKMNRYSHVHLTTQNVQYLSDFHYSWVSRPTVMKIGTAPNL